LIAIVFSIATIPGSRLGDRHRQNNRNADTDTSDDAVDDEADCHAEHHSNRDGRARKLKLISHEPTFQLDRMRVNAPELFSGPCEARAG
jgi:hypothetical protein